MAVNQPLLPFTAWAREPWSTPALIPWALFAILALPGDKRGAIDCNYLPLFCHVIYFFLPPPPPLTIKGLQSMEWGGDGAEPIALLQHPAQHPAPRPSPLYVNPYPLQHLPPRASHQRGCARSIRTTRLGSANSCRGRRGEGCRAVVLRFSSPQAAQLVRRRSRFLTMRFL